MLTRNTLLLLFFMVMISVSEQSSIFSTPSTSTPMIQSSESFSPTPTSSESSSSSSSSSSPTSEEISPSPTASALPVSASCNITDGPVTCPKETCCIGSEGEWMGVHKAGTVPYNVTVHCINGTESSEMWIPCVEACIKKECDGASAIVVGHVFAACLTFAVFWIITE